MMGSMPTGAAVRLMAHEDVLGIAEGIETAMSASILFNVPCWAALNAGLVPIVTRVAAIPDVVTEGVHGVFVPGRDPQAIARAIAALDADRARLARMAAACRERIATSYSIERLAEDFTMLYQKLERKSWAPSQAG